MTTILRAEAQINAKDNTGAAFASIEKKVDHLAHKAQAVDKVSTSLNKVAAANKAASNSMISGLSNINKMDKSWSTLNNKIASSSMIGRLSSFTAKLNEAANASKRLEQSTAKIASKGQGVGAGGIVHGTGHGRHSLATGILEAAGAHRLGHLGKSVLETYREFDKEARYLGAILGRSPDQIAPLKNQALHGGATTKFNDIQWLETQRTLAARGLKQDAILGVSPIAATLGNAMDLTMPEAATLLEGGLFTFGKDTHSREAAEANSKKMADEIVKAQKISGMSMEDIEHGMQMGGAAFKMAGLGPEELFGLMAAGKKGNISGSLMGQAARKMALRLLNPTSQGKMALAASGIKYSDYQKTPDAGLDENLFADRAGAKYGLNLKTNKALMSHLKGIFDNEETIADDSKFGIAMKDALKEFLPKKDQKNAANMVGFAQEFRKAQIENVDSKKLYFDLLQAMHKNPQIANSFLGMEQGSRYIEATRDLETLHQFMDQIRNESGGYAQDISDKRMAGFDGAVSRLEGAIKTAFSNVGQSLDGGGNDGFLTQATNKIGEVITAFAEAGPQVHQLAVEAGVAATAFLGFKSLQALSGGFGLSASATALDESAAALTSAAARLGGGGVPGQGGMPGAPGGTPAKPGMPWIAPIGTVLGALFGAQMADTALDIAEASPQGKAVQSWVEKSTPEWFQKYLWGNKDTPQWVINPIGAAVDGAVQGAVGTKNYVSDTWAFLTGGEESLKQNQFQREFANRPTNLPSLLDANRAGRVDQGIASLGDMNVQAQLTGEINGTIGVTVEASPDLIAKVTKQAISSTSPLIKLNTGSDDSGRNGSRDGR